MQAYDAIPPPQAIIALPAVLPLSSVLSLPPMFYSRDFFPPEKISPPKDTETLLKHPFQLFISSQKRETIKSSLAVNLSTSMVRKEQLASFASLSETESILIFSVATVPEETNGEVTFAIWYPNQYVPILGGMHTPNLLE
ncbi:hypothetical protein Tco_0983205 [Tanacetum coccineum]